MKIHSIKFKISILYTLALGLLLIAHSFFLYISLHNDLTDDINAELKEKSHLIQSSVANLYASYYQQSWDSPKALRQAIQHTLRMEKASSENLPQEIGQQNWLMHLDHLDLTEDSFLFFDPETNHALYTHNIGPRKKKALLDAIRTQNWDKTHLSRIAFPDQIYRMIQEPFRINDRRTVILQIATSQQTALSLLDDRRNSLLFSLPIVIALAVGIGRIFANALTSPLINVAQTAEQISYRDLGQRIVTEYKDQEVNVLVTAFNTMLDRIEHSFKHIAQFNSHVSHELKTPIAIISGECEVALRKAQTAEEYQETLRAVFGEAQKMLRITEDLLLLARLDYSPGIFKFERFALKEFFQDMLLKISKLLNKDIALKLTLPPSDAWIKGDSVHLRRLFLNIINNAIKFTPKGGKVMVTVGVSGQKLTVKITDTGIGITKEDLKQVFDQFYQKSPVNPRKTEGNGLGLSIAQAIAKIHNGNIQITSIPRQGTNVLVTLPIVDTIIDPDTTTTHSTS